MLLSRHFERTYTNRKNAQRSSGMCYRCRRHRHFIAECPEAMEVKPEQWSQEEGASNGGRCKRHRLNLLLLFIELK
jgi:hypothetical protein